MQNRGANCFCRRFVQLFSQIIRSTQNYLKRFEIRFVLGTGMEPNLGGLVPLWSGSFSDLVCFDYKN